MSARRLAATLAVDVRVQLRNGFYHASALVVVAAVVLMRSLPAHAVEWMLPVVIFQNVMTNTFFFVAGLVLLEKGEGIHQAQAVTPLRTRDYLLSKVGSLSALSLVESLLIVLLARGIQPGLFTIGAGILLASLLLSLIGIAVVSRYGSINEYLMPAVLYSALLSLPLLGYYGIGARWLYAWHPLHGPFELVASSATLSAGGSLLAVVLSAAWLLPIAWWGRRSMRELRAA